VRHPAVSTGLRNTPPEFGLRTDIFTSHGAIIPLRLGVVAWECAWAWRAFPRSAISSAYPDKAATGSASACAESAAAGAGAGGFTVPPADGNSA
jgi:hypothetical protein